MARVISIHGVSGVPLSTWAYGTLRPFLKSSCINHQLCPHLISHTSMTSKSHITYAVRCQRLNFGGLWPTERLFDQRLWWPFLSASASASSIKPTSELKLAALSLEPGRIGPSLGRASNLTSRTCAFWRTPIERNRISVKYIMTIGWNRRLTPALLSQNKFEPLNSSCYHGYCQTEVRTDWIKISLSWNLYVHSHQVSTDITNTSRISIFNCILTLWARATMGAPYLRSSFTVLLWLHSTFSS